MKTIRSLIHQNKSIFSVLILLVVLLLVYLIGPLRLCFVPSGSMEPNIPTWSLCFVNVWKPYEDIEEGDVVVYTRKSDGMRIIHRVIEITDDALVTKGDANRIDDGPSVTPDNLYGKYIFHIPKIGKPLAMMKTPAGIAVTAVVVLGLLFWMSAEDKREGNQEKKNREGQK